jgi:outer membrane protein insertion porin family
VAINTGTLSRKFNVDFSEPWVFNRKIRFGFGVYHTESSLADTYDQTVDGFYLRIGKEFWRDTEGFLTYTLNQNDISDVDDSVSKAIQDEQGTSLVSSLKNDWVYEGRDNRFFPTSGWYLHPEFTLAGGPLGGDQDFYKFEFEAKNHKLVFDFGDQKEHVLSHRLKLGYVDHYADSDKVAIFERFFAGGMGSVRGFANRSLGPKDDGDEIGGQLLSVYNLEYSVPINQRSIRGVLFWDTGNVFADISDAKVDDLRSSIGFGLRLMIPALGQMPLALDFAKPIRHQDDDETEVFSFNFGNFF